MEIRLNGQPCDTQEFTAGSYGYVASDGWAYSYRLAIIGCTAAVVFFLYDYYRAGLESDRELESMRRLEGEPVAERAGVPDGTPQTETGGEEEPADPGQENVNPYTEVFRDYPDIKGWLLAEGTAIDYPILQREGDDEYYLYRDSKGEDDKRGSLILDEDSSMEEGECTTNLLVHGHNMKDGSMFGGLDEYRYFYDNIKKLSLWQTDNSSSRPLFVGIVNHPSG